MSVEQTVVALGIREVIVLALATLGAFFAMAKMLLAQFTGRLDDAMEARDDLMTERFSQRDQRLQSIERSQQREEARISGIHQALEAFQQKMPLEYLRREDHIRFSAVIDAKLDRLAEMLRHVNDKGH